VNKIDRTENNDLLRKSLLTMES